MAKLNSKLLRRSQRSMKEAEVKGRCPQGTGGAASSFKDTHTSEVIHLTARVPVCWRQEGRERHLLTGTLIVQDILSAQNS